MVTALYAVILAGLMIWLAVQVIKQRRRHRVKYRDGGVNALTLACSAQGNATEYVPITLILMGLAETNGAAVWWIHLCGIAFMVGRMLHAKAILNDQLKGRVIGMKLTFGVMTLLMVLNLIYLPYAKLW
ncbi:MAPEG family protein [Vibrio sp. ABG19]|uniref:MAPEG family protein n=1 Tax=Vibrio sp. ABG19 TaxID=2817385 RepID=UPI00249D8F2F|nr:MAPEG family protein [Vibrio sp. ABG19]WGY45598.1 MAPEG family protein [Vibrio sp. ABG19]